MGAADIGPFDNDFAEDLCDEIRELTGDQVIDAMRRALKAATDVPEGAYLERDFGEAAVAASAIALAKRLEKANVLEEIELESVIPPIPDDIFPLIIAALERTLQNDSEIRILWEQVGAEASWAEVVKSLSIQAQEIVN